MIWLQLLGSVLGMAAAWYASKQLRKWLQAWKNVQQVKEQTGLKKETEKQAVEANKQSENFDAIEDKWASRGTVKQEGK